MMTGITWGRRTVHEELRRLRREQQLRAASWTLAVLASIMAVVGAVVLIGT